MKFFVVGALSTLGVLLITGCSSKTPPPLPEGVMHLEGVLQPAELSLVRRGTHILFDEQAENALYFVESTAVNLRASEGKLIALTGSLQYNTDPFDLPVFIATELELREDPIEPTTVESLNVTLSIPTDWTLEETDGQVFFFLTGEESPVATLFADQSEISPDASQILVDGNRAYRTVDEETGHEDIMIERPDGVLHFLFTPRDTTDVTAVKAQWIALLHSVDLGGSDTRTDPTHSTGSLVPCGGTAGILCPDGMYCDVYDLEENIGHCRQIGH